MAKSYLGLALLLAASQEALAQTSGPWGQCEFCFVSVM